MSSFLIYQPVCSFVGNSCLMELLNKTTVVFLISFVLADFFFPGIFLFLGDQLLHILEVPVQGDSPAPQAVNHPPLLTVFLAAFVPFA